MTNIEIIKMLINALDTNGVAEEADKQAALALLDNLKIAPKKEATEAPAKAVAKPLGRKPVDHGKILALHDAGWPVKKIAGEIGVSEQTVKNHLKKEAVS